MRELLISVEFWAAMALAAFIKLRASPKITIWAAMTTIITAVLSALVFTKPLMAYLELTGDLYVAAVAALVALSAEHVARQVLDMDIKELIRAWRGDK